MLIYHYILDYIDKMSIDKLGRLSNRALKKYIYIYIVIKDSILATLLLELIELKIELI